MFCKDLRKFIESFRGIEATYKIFVCKMQSLIKKTTVCLSNPVIVQFVKHDESKRTNHHGSSSHKTLQHELIADFPLQKRRNYFSSSTYERYSKLFLNPQTSMKVMM